MVAINKYYEAELKFSPNERPFRQWHFDSLLGVLKSFDVRWRVSIWRNKENTKHHVVQPAWQRCLTSDLAARSSSSSSSAAFLINYSFMRAVAIY